MARGGRYKVKFRRRRKGLTNYYKRRKYILSGKPRLIIRKTNSHIIAQIIVAKPQGDEILVAAHSSELRRFKWLGDTNNTPAAYLTGLLIGLRASKLGIKEVIVDIGLHRPTKGSRIFATLKGAIDGGLKIPHSPEIFPSEDRIEGVHISKYAEIIKVENPSLYERMFSQYLKRGLEPTDLPKHFKEIKQNIIHSLTSKPSS